MSLFDDTCSFFEMPCYERLPCPSRGNTGVSMSLPDSKPCYPMSVVKSIWSSETVFAWLPDAAERWTQFISIKSNSKVGEGFGYIDAHYSKFAVYGNLLYKYNKMYIIYQGEKAKHHREISVDSEIVLKKPSFWPLICMKM